MGNGPALRARAVLNQVPGTEGNLAANEPSLAISRDDSAEFSWNGGARYAKLALDDPAHRVFHAEFSYEDLVRNRHWTRVGFDSEGGVRMEHTFDQMPPEHPPPGWRLRAGTLRPQFRMWRLRWRSIISARGHRLLPRVKPWLRFQEKYKDANGVVLFRLNQATGECIEATVLARRSDGLVSTYPEAFLPTAQARETWARERLVEQADSRRLPGS